MMKILIIQSVAAILLLSAILFLPGCSVMKNKYSESADSLGRRELSKTESSSLHSTNRANRLLVVNDSMDHQYSAEIFPKGQFHYSPSEGFRGEASRIVVKGQIKRRLTSADSAAASSSLDKQKSAGLKENAMSRKSTELKEKEVKKPGGVAIWWLVLLFAGLALVWWWGKGRTRIFPSILKLVGYIYFWPLIPG